MTKEDLIKSINAEISWISTFPGSNHRERILSKCYLNGAVVYDYCCQKIANVSLIHIDGMPLLKENGLIMLRCSEYHRDLANENTIMEMYKHVFIHYKELTCLGCIRCMDINSLISVNAPKAKPCQPQSCIKCKEAMSHFNRRLTNIKKIDYRSRAMKRLNKPDLDE